MEIKTTKLAQELADLFGPVTEFVRANGSDSIARWIQIMVERGDVPESFPAYVMGWIAEIPCAYCGVSILAQPIETAATVHTNRVRNCLGEFFHPVCGYLIVQQFGLRTVRAEADIGRHDAFAEDQQAKCLVAFGEAQARWKEREQDADR